MKETIKFATVKVDHSFECLTSGKEFYDPHQGGRPLQTDEGSVFYGSQSALNFGGSLSLVQVNSVLDESKPRGQKFVFHGSFFFCLPFVIKLINFSLSFLLVKTRLTNHI